MPLTAPEILGVAGQLLDDHRPPPELPVDLAVHAAVALAGEHPRYTELSCSDGRRRLVFTLVTSTRVLQLSVPEDRESDADGADVATDVWPLETLEELRLLPPRPRSAAEDPIGPVRTRWRLPLAARLLRRTTRPAPGRGGVLDPAAAGRGRPGGRPAGRAPTREPPARTCRPRPLSRAEIGRHDMAGKSSSIRGDPDGGRPSARDLC